MSARNQCGGEAAASVDKPTVGVVEALAEVREEEPVLVRHDDRQGRADRRLGHMRQFGDGVLIVDDVHEEMRVAA